MVDSSMITNLVAMTSILMTSNASNVHQAVLQTHISLPLYLEQFALNSASNLNEGYSFVTDTPVMHLWISVLSDVFFSIFFFASDFALFESSHYYFFP